MAYFQPIKEIGETPLTPPDEPAYYDAAIFSGDGRGVFVTSDKDSEFLRLMAHTPKLDEPDIEKGLPVRAAGITPAAAAVASSAKGA